MKVSKNWRDAMNSKKGNNSKYYVSYLCARRMCERGNFILKKYKQMENLN
jgi:hypothetical protein